MGECVADGSQYMTPLTADTGLLDLRDAGESILVRTEPEAHIANQFAMDVARGLAADRKTIPSQYLYDVVVDDLDVVDIQN